jgi:hypothetical protein
MVWSSSQMTFQKTLHRGQKKVSVKNLDKNSPHLYYYHENCVCSNMIYYKSVTIHILVSTEWSICKRATLQVHVIQFSHISSHNLININESIVGKGIRNKRAKIALMFKRRE